MKMRIFLIVLLAIATSLLAAEPEAPAKGVDMSIPMESHPPQRKITPPITPQVKDGSSVTSAVSFIWWKAYLNGLNYVTSGSADTGGTYVANGSNATTGCVTRPSFAFKPGFKAGMGGPCHHDNWDIRGDYTWLRGGDMKSSYAATSSSGLNSLVAITMPGGSVTTFSASQAKSHHKQQFNIVDLELGRSFFISQNLILRPHLGTKTAWVQESFRFDYVMSPTAAVTFNSAVVPLGVQTVVNASAIRTQNMWGVGVRTGLNSEWKFNRNFGFYTKMVLSALWSDFHVHARDKTLSSGVGDTTNLNSRQSVVQVTPILETSFGLSYVEWIQNESYRFQGRVGWEQQAWLDMNHMLLANQGGNLTLQGVTADFNFTF